VADWRRQAACRNADPALFFAETVPGHYHRIGEPPRYDPEPALQICAACPVRDDCLEHALRVPEEYGVWGGMTEDDRRSFRRRRSRRIR
jgi:WhiB family transcriptional regulator, redox-sensing transcriptional regulator